MADWMRRGSTEGAATEAGLRWGGRTAAGNACPAKRPHADCVKVYSTVLRVLGSVRRPSWRGVGAGGDSASDRGPLPALTAIPSEIGLMLDSTVVLLLLSELDTIL